MQQWCNNLWTNQFRKRAIIDVVSSTNQGSASRNLWKMRQTSMRNESSKNGCQHFVKLTNDGANMEPEWSKMGIENRLKWTQDRGLGAKWCKNACGVGSGAFGKGAPGDKSWILNHRPPAGPAPAPPQILGSYAPGAWIQKAYGSMEPWIWKACGSRRFVDPADLWIQKAHGTKQFVDSKLQGKRDTRAQGYKGTRNRSSIPGVGGLYVQYISYI